METVLFIWSSRAVVDIINFVPLNEEKSSQRGEVDRKKKRRSGVLRFFDNMTVDTDLKEEEDLDEDDVDVDLEDEEEDIQNRGISVVKPTGVGVRELGNIRALRHIRNLVGLVHILVHRLRGSATKPTFKQIPKKGMVYFSTTQFDGILKKIIEFNTHLLSDNFQGLQKHEKKLICSRHRWDISLSKKDGALTSKL